MSADWIKRGERITTTHYSRDFSWEGEPVGNGFGFPCDEQGNLLQDEHVGSWMQNYEACLTGVVDGRKVVDRGIVSWQNTYWEPGVIRCLCGAEVVIDMLMTNTCNACIKCGQDESFGWHKLTAEECEAWMQKHVQRSCSNPAEHHEFQVCARDYSSSGQLLAPRSQWGWDTGESLDDILMSDERLT